MKKRFTEAQIIGFLREAEAGLPVKDLCRRHGFSEASDYLWRSKFGGMSVSDAKPSWLLCSSATDAACLRRPSVVVVEPAQHREGHDAPGALRGQAAAAGSGSAARSCPSRIRCQTATGSWTKSWQWETQRTLFSSARATMWPPTKVDGVWPFNDAWLRTSLSEARRHATVPQSWIQRENWEFETHTHRSRRIIPNRACRNPSAWRSGRW